jgi:hypothetical protein
MLPTLRPRFVEATNRLSPVAIRRVFRPTSREIKEGTAYRPDRMEMFLLQSHDISLSLASVKQREKIFVQALNEPEA